jgi:hypothetical protein
MIAMLHGACYAVRSMVHNHSIIKYRIIGGGNSCNSRKIFTLQKKITRIMAGAQPRTSRRSVFKQLRDSTYSTPVYILINELHYQYSGNVSNKFIYTQYYYKK